MLSSFWSDIPVMLIGLKVTSVTVWKMADSMVSVSVLQQQNDIHVYIDQSISSAITNGP